MSTARISTILLIASAALAQSTPSAVSPPSDERAVALATDFARKAGIKSGEPFQVLPLGGAWKRVRIPIDVKEIPLFRIVLVNGSGQVIDPQAAWNDSIGTILDIAGAAKTPDQFKQHINLYLQIHRPEETVLIKGIRDIPGYEKRPLAVDLETLPREPWSDQVKNKTNFICYTYQKVGGKVERWVFTFIDGKIERIETLQLPGIVGDAILYE